MGIFDKLPSLFGGGDPAIPTEPKKIESPYDQSAEDLELVAFVKNKVETCRGQSNRIASEGIWMTNIAYLLGYNNVFYDPNLKQFRPTDQPRRFIARNRIHTNLILPSVQNRLARLLKSPPKYEVRPNSNDNEDKEGARIGLDVINDVWDDQKINEKRIPLGMWTQECGHAYIKISFDDQLGEPLYDLDTNELLGYEGKVRADIASAFEIFPDPLAKTLEDCNHLVQAKVRPLEYFRSHYPETGGAVKEEGAWLLSAQYEMRINTLSTVGPASSGTAEQMKNSAIELSYYEKRSKKYPEGRHIVVANGILLKNDVLPVGEIPFAKFDDVVIGGKYYSEALITHARPLQDQYDRVLNKRSEWTNRLLAGKYIAARPHGLQQESVNDQSGEVIEYDPEPGGATPQVVPPPQMPEYAYKETDYLKGDIYEIFGLSEISRGQLPAAGIPAVGMQLLVEQDETRIGIETEQHEHAWARVGMLILKYVDKFYKTDRKLKKKNKNGSFDIEEYNGQSLRKNFDVTVKRGSLVPNNKALQRQEILNAWQSGLYGNPQDPNVLEYVRDSLEFGDSTTLYKDSALDDAQIQKDIDMMRDGMVPVVNKYDNHAYHLFKKNQFRKTEDYMTWSPESQAIFEANMDMHAEEGAKLANPGIMTPPDGGPPPEEMLSLLNEQANAIGINEPTPLDQEQVPLENNNIALG